MSKCFLCYCGYKEMLEERRLSFLPLCVILLLVPWSGRRAAKGKIKKGGAYMNTTIHMKRSQIGNSFPLLMAAAIWGFSFVAQSVGMDYVGPFTFTAARGLLGGFFLLIIIQAVNCYAKTRVKKPEELKDKKTSRDLAIGGTLCGLLLAGGMNLQQFGIQYTTVGRAGFITALYIVIVPILGMIFFHKKSRLAIWLSVALALVGLYLLCITEEFGIGMGDLYILISSIFFSLHMLVIDHYSPKVSGVKMSCIQFFVSGGLSLILALCTEQIRWTSLTAAWQPLLYAGVLSCGAAYTLQIIGQRNVNPTAASLLLSLESCISVLAGWVILGERLTLREGIGCVLMFAGVILAQLPDKADQKEVS